MLDGWFCSNTLYFDISNENGDRIGFLSLDAMCLTHILKCIFVMEFLLFHFQTDKIIMNCGGVLRNIFMDLQMISHHTRTLQTSVIFLFIALEVGHRPRVQLCLLEQNLLLTPLD